MSIPKKVKRKVHDRSGGQCEICGSTHGLQHHHIVKKSQCGPDTFDNIILLCWDHHHGTYGVHGREGSELDRKLKLQLQEKYFEQGKSEKEVRRLMGNRLYIDEAGDFN